MLGAIIGDVVGSRFEWNNLKSKDFELFHADCHITDDSVLTVAVADALLRYTAGTDSLTVTAAHCLREYGCRYPLAGYGARFMTWLFRKNAGPYNSLGNGSAMRVGPAGFWGQTLKECLTCARDVTMVTHNHPEGVKGAEATTTAIWLGRQGAAGKEIREFIDTCYYPLNFSLADIRDSYTYDITCAGTVPQAVVAVAEATDFEDAIRNAISLGGDSDTLAAIAGSIAEACFGVPEDMAAAVRPYVPDELWQVMERFYQQARTAE